MSVKRNLKGGLESVSIRRPSDFHAHLREGAMMQAVARAMAQHVKYLLFMPNNGPIRTIDDAKAYGRSLARITNEVNTSVGFIPTLYHTADVTPEVIIEAASEGLMLGIKSYPLKPGSTTGSGLGVPLLESTDTLKAMEETGIPLLIHGEIETDKYNRELEPRERESEFVKTILPRLREKHPRLRISLEHASTIEAVRFVKADPSGLTVMTVTPQHLNFTADDFPRFSWGNHMKCMPSLKNLDHRAALREFVFSGDFRVIAGSDSAPHPSKTKDGVPFDKANNGCYTPHAIPLYARAFEDGGALKDGGEKFERFMSLNGPLWWGLPDPDRDDIIVIGASENDIPEPVAIPGTEDVVTPLGWTTEADRLRVGLAILRD